MSDVYSDVYSDTYGSAGGGGGGTVTVGSYKVYVDFTGDGDFADTGEDVTSRTLPDRTPIAMDYGRDQNRNLSPIKVGEAHFALNNRDRALSPENTGSPLYGQVVPGRAVKIDCVHPTLGTVTLYRGYLDDFDLLPAFDERYVTVDCLDGLGQLTGQNVTTGLYRGLRPGEAVGVLLDAVGWPPDQRDLDVGATVMPYWWLDNEDAYQALMDLVASEGPPALATVDATGKLVFRGRHHRLQRTASTAVQSTWRSSGDEPLISPPAVYGHGWKEIINSVTFEYPQRAGTGVPTVVWQSQGQISVGAGATLPIVAQASDPFLNAVIPVQTTGFYEDGSGNGDYTVLAGTVSVTLGRTSGLSTTIFVTAGAGGTAVIADLQLRASGLPTVTTVQVQVEDGPSITKYGRRTLPDGRSPKWASLGDATAIAGIILGQRGDRLPTIRVTMQAAGGDARLTQQLTRDLSDRVHLVETHTGLDSDCFVEQISHEITGGGTDHRTTFGLEKIPAQITGALILGTGLLGTGKLGRRGFTDPSAMIVLGTQATLGTNVLTP